MILRIQGVLTAEQVRHCREVLAAATLVDGRVTAGQQSGEAKRNLQLPEESAEARELGEMVVTALAASPRFMSAALPLKVYPPLFNRYAEGMSFGAHIDNAIRTSPATGARYRTDLSATLFLSDPDDYDGGGLIIGGDGGEGVKLPAGDLLLYPAATVHSVAPVTRGERWASFFWVQSLARDASQRETLFQLDQAIIAARADLGDAHPAAIALVGVYHNLVRMWAQP